jgi:mono/diheme cytochrome c family protein
MTAQSAHLRLRALLLGATLAVLLGSLGGCRGATSSAPPIHPNPNMDNVHRFDPQEPNRFYADGRAMRLPVPGTLAYGQLRSDTHLWEGRVAGELVNELPPQLELSQALLERGQDRYQIFCEPCHGVAGYSDGVTVARGMLQPPSFHDQRMREAPLGHFLDVMSNGIRNMPPYRSQIPIEDRWAIAVYMRALQASQVASLE